jgi:hypothetical protein
MREDLRMSCTGGAGDAVCVPRLPVATRTGLV